MAQPDDEFTALLGEIKGLILTGFSALSKSIDRLEDRVDQLEARLDDLQNSGFFYEH